MLGVNRVFIGGFLGTDPRTSTDRKGNKFTRLNVATHYRLPAEKGDHEVKTQWHNIYVWGRRGETCALYLKKGSAVLVEGFINQYESQSDQGEKRYHTSITAERVEFLSPTQNSESVLNS